MTSAGFVQCLHGAISVLHRKSDSGMDTLMECMLLLCMCMNSAVVE
jgi:hypothetical protein